MQNTIVKGMATHMEFIIFYSTTENIFKIHFFTNDYLIK